MIDTTAFNANTLRHRTRLACGLIPLLNMLNSRGVAHEELLGAVGIRKSELIDPAFTISFEQELKLVEKALEFLPEPSASLELASHYHLHNFSVLGLAIRSCATLGDIFDLIMRYPRLVWGICETSGEIRDDVIAFELRAGSGREERFLLERDMACIKTLFSEALGGELELLEVHFAHDGPEQIEAYQEFFGCPVSFGQQDSGLSFPLSTLERQVPTADALSKEFYEAQCARIAAEIDEPFRYSAMIRDHLSRLTPIPGLEELARSLQIEPRTLQRQLKKEQETFSHILQEVRHKRAMDRLLYADLTTEQIALELGFNDAVAFSHAFKQWTGLAPRPWLKQIREQKD